MLYLSHSRGIVDLLATIRALIEFDGWNGIPLSLTGSAYCFTNFFDVFIAAARTKT